MARKVRPSLSHADPLAWWQLLHPGFLCADTFPGDPLPETTSLAAVLAGSLSAVPSPSRPAVGRIALVDRAAHRGELELGAMAKTFANLLDQRLPGVVSLCQSEGRPLVPTADHGLSLVGGRLMHGGGGVFERVVCRIVWPSVQKRS